MSLIQLPEEVLVQIFSNAILDSTDLANLAVSCRRLNSTALLSLYEDIKLKCDGPSRFRKLDLLIAILESHPIRASRVRSLDISWKEDTPEITNKISNLLHKLLTLENLTLNISNATSNYYSCHRTFSNPLDNLHTWPFASLLHTLTISDQKMNILDIGTIFTLPNLKHLSISRFDTTATEGISSAMLALAPPLCKLKTLAVWWSSHPRGWRAQYLLRGHSCLESLTWVCGHGFPNTRTSWSNGPLSPTDMFKLLEPMSDTLVHLRLSADLACYGGPEIDFSRFPALKILHVNYHSLFLMSEDTLVGENNMRRYTLGSREGLWGRLPRLLEDLRVCCCLLFDLIY
jgi:hypothetical protein